MDLSKDSLARGLAVVQQAMSCYAAMAGYRHERQRNKRYHYGDQWSDMVEVDGCRITEQEYIKRQGSVPLKNNLIRRLVRNVIGVYSSQAVQPVCVARDSAEAHLAETMTRMLQYNMQLNRLSTLYTRSLEEFLIGGLVVHRKSYGYRNGRTDCWTDYVQPNSFFIDNAGSDFRGWDCQCVGQIHDIDRGCLISRFARCQADVDHLACIYGDDPKCRVIEVWRREYVNRCICHDRTSGMVRYLDTADNPGHSSATDTDHNGDIHWTCSEVWRYYFVSPEGHILAEGNTPYAHGGHPYVVKAYPMIDGEIHSFVNDVIDQQRYTNRLITLYDWIMRSSAKGVLLIPEDCVPPGVSPSSFAEAWSRFNGVIVYRPSMQGNVPQQVSANSTDIGIRDLLNVQLKFFEDISGVSGALQGRTSNVGVSADLYGQQTQNATTTLLDLLDTFGEFVRDAAYKDVKNMQQFYDRDHYRNVVGRAPGTSNNVRAIADAEFDLNIAPCLNTPAVRNTTNEQLMEIWKSGQITLQQMLHAGHFPFADKLTLESDK